ncbi:MAG: response regulator [Chloroflexaceae bacterium]|nr:response regulator [Chloroflexaceae bacterium]NJO05077.1 response regulator [Chloroflexaceae bacterium]
MDDDPIGREFLTDILTAAGYDCQTRSGGLDALQYLHHTTPDLILLDVMMPDMDGFEVCQRIRSMPHLTEIPIILITALSDRESRIRGLEAGADDFLSKPIDLTELRVRVRNIARLNRYRQLIEERSKFTWMAEHAEAGYLVLTADDTITYANALACKYLGLEKGDPRLYHTPFNVLVAKRYSQEPRDAWTTWPTPTTDAMNRLLVLPETTVSRAQWLQVQTLPLMATGDYLVHLHDVSEVMNMQQDILGFHAMITHKLRTPLVGVLGSLEVMQYTLGNVSDPAVSEMLHVALESANRLHQDVQNVLSYLNRTSLPQQGRTFRLGELPALVADVARNLYIEQPRVQLPIELVDVTVSLTGYTVEVIVHELLQNARKFHPQQMPHITITVQHSANNSVTIQVGDDGKRLSLSQLEHATMLYYQGEKSLTGEVPGMGLGLPTITSLLWSAGGGFQIANREPGPGVLVTLSVPIAKVVDETPDLEDLNALFQKYLEGRA